MNARMVSIILCKQVGPAARFGLDELRRALQARGYSVLDERGDIQIVLEGQAEAAAPPNPAKYPLGHHESYTLTRPAPDTLLLTGSDDNGLMYGCLDLAEQLELGRDLDAVAERRVEPELAVRGVHLFLHNEEAERAWVDDPAFWQAYADELARCRYNRFNLIYGHQSPYLVPIYAFMLDDLDEAFPEIRVRDITPEERARNLRALHMASDAMSRRGITFFLGIWNSRPWKVKNGVWEDQPTRVSGTDDLGRLTAYTRQGFTRLIERCPNIGGIQLRMNIESGVADQRFFVQAFVPALQDLASRDRRLVVELRNWGLHPDTVDAFRNSGLQIVVSTKYFAEHQAMPYQPPVMRGSYSYDSFLRVDKPFPFQWHFWNLGSHRLFAWGDPDYARRFALSCHLGDGVGFDLTPPGSQKGFSQWGQVHPGDWQARTDLAPRADGPPPAGGGPRWAFQRYWFFHLAFGRMAYDPSTPDEVFLHQLAMRTNAEVAPVLLAAYRVSSKVISYLISQRMDDRNMYAWPELDCGGPIDHNTLAPPGEVTLFATAREHADERVSGRVTAKRSPFDCARDLGTYADEIEAHLAELARIPDLKDNLEYRTVCVDFAALAALARYHAAKSRATGSLALFYASGERRWLDAAEAEAERGVALWRELCDLTAAYYPKLHLGPTGGHWRDNLPRAQYDLRRVRRVRELFDRYGLFARGFDFGPRWLQRQPPRALSGLEPEPRFTAVDETTAYSPQTGCGWTRTAGLRAAGLAQLGRELLWGVHQVRPSVEYDPAAVQQMPTDGLTQGYLMADEPRTFRVDLPNGEYVVTLIAPAMAALTTPVRIGDATAQLGGPSTTETRIDVTVDNGEADGGALEITIGGAGPWALAGLVVQSRWPEIAHLPAAALPAERDAAITATATAPDGVRGLGLRLNVEGTWRELPMLGDGTAFCATMPADQLTGDALEYELVAEGVDGLAARRSARVEVVRDFQAPAVVSWNGPENWSPDKKLILRLTLKNGRCAREVRLHYREADQNREFRAASLPGGRSGEYVFEIDPRHLDGAYDLIYYWEVIDVLGGGSFYPDPFEEARYYICRARSS